MNHALRARRDDGKGTLSLVHSNSSSTSSVYILLRRK